MLKEVLWFATEVPRKYATRYRSVAAWELQRKGECVGEWVGLVAHEHVWTRATCRIRLLSAPDRAMALAGRWLPAPGRCCAASVAL